MTTNKPKNVRLTDEDLEDLISELEAAGFYRRQLIGLAELQERRKADSAELIYQYRIRNGYNGQVTEWQTIRRDQVDFVLKAQPLNAEFRIISAPQPAPVVPEEKRDEDGNTISEFDHGWNACRAAMLQAGNSPATGFDPASGPDHSVEVRYFAPPGYVLVPIKPTENMIISGFESEPDEFFSKSEEWDAYQEMSGCEQAAHRAKLCWAAMIKAAPQQEDK